VLVTETPELLFVSTRFLFPLDSGGKIRTTQILRGLKGGRFRIRLMSPATDAQMNRYAGDLNEVCDEYRSWAEPRRGPLYRYLRMRYFFGALPIPVRTDRHTDGINLIARALEDGPAVVVFDFAHAAVLAPSALACPSVMFTHNVEAEIFRRHRDVTRNPLLRVIWDNQYGKMHDFEERTLKTFDVVVAVAERDKKQFDSEYGINEPIVIPTGVDLDYYSYQAPERHRDVVFLGSMDWMANQEAVVFFMNEVWDKIVVAVPDAKMTVVGRAPPERLVQNAKRRKLNWSFTGFVDDVRPYVQGSAVSVIPLSIGGGTRLKVYEAMAMGSPVVSTSIGVEGLPVSPGIHYLEADDAAAFADAVINLVTDDERRTKMALDARAFVESNFSYSVAAQAFESACNLAIERFKAREMKT
jgi:glycosyltransferase involved in cell wall biosynthesis